MNAGAGVGAPLLAVGEVVVPPLAVLLALEDALLLVALAALLLLDATGLLVECLELPPHAARITTTSRAARPGRTERDDIDILLTILSTHGRGVCSGPSGNLYQAVIPLSPTCSVSDTPRPHRVGKPARIRTYVKFLSD